MNNQVIPDEAVEAAGYATTEGVYGSACDFIDEDLMRAALEAALPILLSHEREETRLARLDAVVNAATVDRLEGELRFLRGERKSLLKHLASWEQQEHSTVGIDFLRRHLTRKKS